MDAEGKTDEPAYPADAKGGRLPRAAAHRVLAAGRQEEGANRTPHGQGPQGLRRAGGPAAHDPGRPGVRRADGVDGEEGARLLGQPAQQRPQPDPAHPGGGTPRPLAPRQRPPRAGDGAGQRGVLGRAGRDRQRAGPQRRQRVAGRAAQGAGAGERQGAQGGGRWVGALPQRRNGHLRAGRDREKTATPATRSSPQRSPRGRRGARRTPSRA